MNRAQSIRAIRFCLFTGFVLLCLGFTWEALLLPPLAIIMPISALAGTIITNCQAQCPATATINFAGVVGDACSFATCNAWNTTSFVLNRPAFGCDYSVSFSPVICSFVSQVVLKNVTAYNDLVPALLFLTDGGGVTAYTSWTGRDEDTCVDTFTLSYNSSGGGAPGGGCGMLSSTAHKS